MMFRPTWELFLGALVFGSGFTIAQILLEFLGDLLRRRVKS